MNGHAIRNDIVEDGFFNVAKIASARVSSLRMAGPLLKVSSKPVGIVYIVQNRAYIDFVESVCIIIIIYYFSLFLPYLTYRPLTGDMGKHIQTPAKAIPRVFLFQKKIVQIVLIIMVQILKFTPVLFFIIYKL